MRRPGDWRPRREDRRYGNRTMAKTQQNDTAPLKGLQEMMGAFAPDPAAFENAFRAQIALGEKLSRVALEAAERSAEISGRWTRESLERAAGASTAASGAGTDPAGYGKAVADLASAQAALAAEQLAALAEVARKAQMETVELVLAAGREIGADAAAAFGKASVGAARRTKQAAAAG